MQNNSHTFTEMPNSLSQNSKRKLITRG